MVLLIVLMKYVLPISILTPEKTFNVMTDLLITVKLLIGRKSRIGSFKNNSYKCSYEITVTLRIALHFCEPSAVAVTNATCSSRGQISVFMPVKFCNSCQSVMWTGRITHRPIEAAGWNLRSVQQSTKWQNLSLDSWLFHHAHLPYSYFHFLKNMESKSVRNHSRAVWPVRMSAGWMLGKLNIAVTTTPQPSPPHGLLIYFRVESRSLKENCAAEPVIHLEMSACHCVVFFLQAFYFSYFGGATNHASFI